MAVGLTELPITPSNLSLGDMISGQDGLLWALAYVRKASTFEVVAINPARAAVVAQFPIPATVNGASPYGLTQDANGHLWFFDSAPSTTVTTYQPSTIVDFDPMTDAFVATPIPLSPDLGGFTPTSLAAASDGNIYFTQAQSTTASAYSLGMISTTTHIVNLFTGAGESSNDMIAGPDGSLYFIDSGSFSSSNPYLDQLQLPGRNLSGFPINAVNYNMGLGSSAESLTATPDGKIWFIDASSNGLMLSFDPSTQTITSFPFAPGSYPAGALEHYLTMAAASDGRLWFTDPDRGKVGVFDPSTDTTTEYAVPDNALPGPIVSGPGGKLYVETTPAGSEFASSQLLQIDPKASAPTVYSTSLKLTAGPASANGMVTLTVDVTTPATSAGTITGNVNFSTDGGSIGSAPLAIVNGVAQATIQVTASTLAAHVITARYEGSPDATFGPSQATLSPANKRSTTLALATSPDPSVSGTAVTLTASLMLSSGSLDPTNVGTITFTIDGVAGSLIPVTPVQTSSAQGQAIETLSNLTAGPHTIVASFSGTSLFFASTSNTVIQTVQPIVSTPVSTTTVLTVTPDPAAAGASITLAATVTPGKAGSPLKGLVTFMDGGTVLSTQAVNADGIAIYTTNSLAAGTHSLTAVYGSDPRFVSSTSTTVRETVAPPTVTQSSDGPRVDSINRYGYHAMPTTLVINFNEPLDTVSAQKTSNYIITGPRGLRITVKIASYDPLKNSVTLQPASRLDLHYTYTLRIVGTGRFGVTGADGLLLDGTGLGRPGSDHVATIDAANLVVLNPHAPGALEAIRYAAEVRSADARAAHRHLPTPNPKSKSHPAPAKQHNRDAADRDDAKSIILEPSTVRAISNLSKPSITMQITSNVLVPSKASPYKTGQVKIRKE